MRACIAHGIASSPFDVAAELVHLFDCWIYILPSSEAPPMAVKVLSFVMSERVQSQLLDDSDMCAPYRQKLVGSANEYSELSFSIVIF